MAAIPPNQPSPLPLQGKSGLTESEVPVQARRVLNHARDVSHTELLAAIKDNNLDEIVVEDADGERFVLYADELAVSEGSLPRPGEQIEYGQVKGEVLFVDDEENEDQVTVGLPSLGQVGVGLQGLLTQESDDAIQKLSIANLDTQFESLPEGVTHEDMMFAIEMGELSKNKQPITADQLTRYTEIHQALAAHKQNEHAATEEKMLKLDWAMTLQHKIGDGAYTPTEEELTRLESMGKEFCFEYHRESNSFSGVSLAEFQWAMGMELKVARDEYNPTEQEQERYMNLANAVMEYQSK